MLTLELLGLILLVALIALAAGLIYYTGSRTKQN
jgi:hypothetical protein